MFLKLHIIFDIWSNCSFYTNGDGFAVLELSGIFSFFNFMQKIVCLVENQKI